MTPLPVGAVLGDLTVEAFLGEGAVAHVYAVQRGDALFALKLARPDLEPALRDGLAHELALQRAVRSPNVVAAHELLELDGRPALLLELVTGPPLDRWLLRQPELVPLDTARTLFEGLVRGVAAIHATGAVHRDLKPENVLIADPLTPKLTDFGMAKRLDAVDREASRGLSLHFDVFGTPAYMAPEQALDAADVDPRADLYSLGCLLYELLCDEVPFPAASPNEVVARAMRREWAPPSARRPELPPAVDALVAALLEPDPRDRVPDAAALLAELTILAT